MNIDELYMQRALELAQHGKLQTAPNPMVGCVIVYENTIIGEGYHTAYGKPHAEVNAINHVKNKELLRESALYVSLEPCSHHGKTPPCADLLIDCHIPNIYIAVTDPNPKVEGKGIQKLKDAGRHVNYGLLEKEAIELNKRFFCFHQKKRPYIILKWAQTLDGYMDKNLRDCQDRESYWITNETLRIKAHQWRAEESAVLVGANTIINDNPQLNVRYCAGKNPIRITIINNLINQDAIFFDNTTPTLVFNFEKEEQRQNIRFCKLSPEEHPEETILRQLYEMNVQSLLIEGGKHTLKRFLDMNLWDEARVLTGNKCFGSGLTAPTIPLEPVYIENVNGDNILWYKNKK
ncbi:MAG: bifunctional diaminohydroxyphosphoribosylaminopyrimidine deaminase/5-amino-6-(5-phosphoribosylamino)uracil reductase RibD [Bacteroidales bacterium]|jgi:diaminohydroxyphosphoribosylaminopyrimidine deaminase/5-amino-6-(5-phosphoribosylamino)uracil reductase|nr:bifunctional diaminohydroxyphosphoribosylaminopyrimidine deaminase/5-amino-6-(5-phosphoribosylamino)uracil reductase RibD [Bacteroidales bacterium]